MKERNTYMSTNLSQINMLWKSFINNQLSSNNTFLNDTVIKFLLESKIDFVDFEECEYGEFGDIQVRFIDFLFNDEEIEVRRIHSKTNDYEPTWGYMHLKPYKHFDYWLRNKFSLNLEQENIVLQWIDKFLHVLFKDKNKKYQQ
jgi:hypothetical protein